MLLLLGSVSFRTETARLYLAQLALFNKRFEPTIVCAPDVNRASHFDAK